MSINQLSVRMGIFSNTQYDECRQQLYIEIMGCDRGAQHHYSSNCITIHKYNKFTHCTS